MLSRSRLLWIRRSTVQLQSSMRNFSIKGPLSLERPHANSVRIHGPQIDRSRRRSTDSKKIHSDLGWMLFDSYHISLNQVRPLEFFGLQELPEPSVDQELLNIADANAMQQDCHNALVDLIDLALVPDPNTPVVRFMQLLFEVVGYLGEDRVAFLWMDLPLVIDRELKHVKPDICIFDLSRKEILLVAQEHKMTVLAGLEKAQIQLVAGAVAAFNHNNLQREKAGLPPLAEKVIPGILMAGTTPCFFKIPVTKTLSSHIRNGTYPPFETRVTYCYSIIPFDRRHEGMKPLDNRREILKCCEAFKVFVGEN